MCGVNRYEKIGYCGCGSEIRVARAALHFWEEPCISGKNGSGTVFFSGCNLRCRYCQNKCISRDGVGKNITAARLADIFRELEAEGAHNINLVTPTHFVPKIIKALDDAKPKIPVVYNCGGFESVQTLKMLSGYVNIYLMDIKYLDNETAVKYSCADGYFDCASAALAEMLVQKPKCEYEGEIMTGGVIVRHLVLPGHMNESVRLVKRLKEMFGTKRYVLSLMSQYTPYEKDEKYPELNRKITSLEYRRVVEAAQNEGFENAYIQLKTSAEKEYTPPFDLTGV